jgi:hypothetical protein
MSTGNRLAPKIGDYNMKHLVVTIDGNMLDKLRIK